MSDRQFIRVEREFNDFFGKKSIPQFNDFFGKKSLDDVEFFI